MENHCAFTSKKERSFVLFKIVPGEEKCVSIEPVADLEPTYYSQDAVQGFVSNIGQNNQSAHEFQGNVIFTRQKTGVKVFEGDDMSIEVNQGTTLDIGIESKKVEILSRSSVSKSEGRKAPGANRILPLITSVWEDADLHRKRQKSHKIGGERKDGKGKSCDLKGTVSEESGEEEWVERREVDEHGGSIFRAYTDFFMAEEAGEDREDCLCSICGAEFLTATHVAYHLEHAHGKGKIKLHQCFVCRRKRYPSQAQLNRHLSEAHGIPRPQLTCRTCFMELAGESEAKAHSRKHQTPYKCSHCPLMYSQNSHRAPVHRFATRFLLAEHIKEVHLPKERPHVCCFCGRHFIHRYVRDLHIRRRHKGQSLICPAVHQNLALEESDPGDKKEICAFVPQVEGVFSLNEKSPSCKGHKSQYAGQDWKLTRKVCCSADCSTFPDEVSLLRHVFLNHEKAVRLQLLKTAREVDKEDTLFEELWTGYSKSSEEQAAVATENEDDEIETFAQNGNFVPPIQMERLSINIYSLDNQSNSERGNDNLTGLSGEEFSELSHIISMPSEDNHIANNNALILPPCQSIINLAQCSSSGFPLKNVPVQMLPLVDNVLSISSVEPSSHQMNQDIDCNFRTNSIKTCLVSEEIDVSIKDAVNTCVTEILDSVCTVLDEKSTQKESRNLSSNDRSLSRAVSSVRCLLCKYLASNPMALERHRKRRHFRNKHCPFCSLACSSTDDVFKHVSDNHLSIQKTVEENNSVEISEEMLQKTQPPKMAQSSSGLRCPICKKTFPSRGKCNTHQENVHKIQVIARPLSCKICSKKFQFPKALERHYLLHGQVEEEKGNKSSLYSCPHCEQTFLRPGFLERHIASHFEETSKGGKSAVDGGGEPLGHSCPSCPRRLSTYAKLKAHIRTSHPPAHLRQRFMCSECPVRCSTASGLRVHLRVHTGERPFTCATCDMAFKRKTALRKHIASVHLAPLKPTSSESMLKCPNCSSLFRDRSNLIRHFIQVHRGLRRFVCGICGAKYGQNQDLRRHLKLNHNVDAPRIIGSDRRSVDQIYVVPPVVDDLPSDHPLARKIREVVEEEERKLDEDNLPPFSQPSPQLLHLHIHKKPVTGSESSSKENKDGDIHIVSAFNEHKPSDSSIDKRNSSILLDHNASSGHPFTSNVNGEGKQDLVSGDIMKDHLEIDSLTIQSGSKIKNLSENKGTSSESNPVLIQRNLILDALISSQVMIDCRRNIGY